MTDEVIHQSLGFKSLITPREEKRMTKRKRLKLKKKKKKRGEESRSSYWREAVENKWVIRNEGAGLSSLWNSVAFMNSNQRFKVLMCTDVVRSLRLKKKLMKGMWWCMLERRRSDDLLYDSGLSRRGEWERWREWVRMEKWKLRTGLVMMIWVWSSQYPR